MTAPRLRIVSETREQRIEQLERAKQSGHALHNFAMQEAA